MSKDWVGTLGSLKRKIYRDKATTIKLPPTFAFKSHDVIDFDKVIGQFDWSIKNRPIKVDFTECKSANYQALSLLVLYLWKLRENNCTVSFTLSEEGASLMWKMMGAQQMFQVSTNEETNFKSNSRKPLVAVRNQNDFKTSVDSINNFIDGFDIKYLETLRYVLSELLYNTLEHGKAYFKYKGQNLRFPSIVQFTEYQTRDEIHFIVADLGIGIKEHLRQAYPAISSDEEALRHAIKPQVSGTFGSSNPYESKNNAGVGLYISSNIIRRLNADMYLVSGEASLHISPRDVTSKTLSSRWPGTFALVTIKLEKAANFELHAMMHEFRESARKELSLGQKSEGDETFYVNIYNYFGGFAEDKEAAIKFRDRYITPKIKEGKKLLLDFENVLISPHSFLSALIATPAKILGMKAYKYIRVINAKPEIRETIDYILDENTEQS